MCYCDGDGPEAFSKEVRRAAKDHRCYECERTIHKGDLYEHHSGIWDGEPETFKWCHDCATIANLVEGLDRDRLRDKREAAVRSGSWQQRADLLDLEPFCFAYGQLIECVGEYLREAA